MLVYTRCSRHVCYTNQKARGRGGRAPARSTVGEMTAQVKIGMKARKRRKKRMRKNDREASRQNSLLLHTSAESWMCHAITEMRHWMGGRSSSLPPPRNQSPIITAHGNPCEVTLQPLSLGFTLLQSWRTLPTMLPTHHFIHCLPLSPPQYHLSAPSQINIINLPNPNDRPDL